MNAAERITSLHSHTVGQRQTAESLVIAAAMAAAALATYFIVQRPELVNLSGEASPRGIALMLAGLALGSVCLRFPDLALCSLVAFVTLNLSDVFVRHDGLPSLLQLLFVPVALAGWWNAAPGSRLPPLVLTLLLSGYLVIALCSTTIAMDTTAADSRLLEQLKGFAVFLVIGMLARSVVALRRAAWTFVICTALLGAFALIQTATGDVTRDFGGLARIKYAHVYGTTFEPRIAGPLGDPNFFAQILVIAVPIAIQLGWTAQGSLRRMLAFCAAGVAGAATLFTYSRGGAVALAVVLSLCLLARGITLRQASLGLVTVLLVLWVALPDDFARRLTTLNQLLPGSEVVLRPDSSFGERKLFAAAAWSMFEDAPLLGVGIGNYGVHFLDHAQRVGSDARLYVTPTEGYYAHNLYLEIAAETGGVSLLLFAAAIAVCFTQLWRDRLVLLPVDSAAAGLATGCAIALAGYMVSSLFLHGHFIRYWWLLVGLSAAVHTLTPAGETRARLGRGSAQRARVSRPPHSPDARGEEGGAMAPSQVRPAIAVIVSRFPLITETFILREIIEMERQGQPVVLVPLMRERPRVVHREAEPWIARALYTPFISAPIVAANVRMLRRRPASYLRTLWRIGAGTIASPNFFVRSLALFPKAVYLAERLERRGVRHMHAHYATHPATVAMVAAAMTDMTFSVTVHAHDIFVRRALLRWKLEACAFVRSISRFNRDFLARFYPDVVARKVHVIHVGIDADAYACNPGSSDASHQPPRVLCVASLQRYKGIPVLIDACRILRERGIELACTIVGEGPMRPALEAQIRHLNLVQTVSLDGARPQHDVTGLMRTATVFVIPSIVAPDGQMEGIPVALMEAMASRLPVVASSLSGIPEAVQDGRTGLLVEPGSAPGIADAIEQLLADRTGGRRMGDAARAAIEREFRLDTCVSDLLLRIDSWNPPPTDAQALRLPAVQAGVAAGIVGLRGLDERRDSRIAHLLVANGRAPHNVVLKIHNTRPGESRPPRERASTEFDIMRRLWRGDHGGLVPRPLHLDGMSASLLMESCAGEPLDALVRTGRLARDAAARRDLACAMHRTGVWLRRFQESTPGGGDPLQSLERLVENVRRDLDRCGPGWLPPSAARTVHSQVDALKSRLAPASLRLTLTHRDFWPGNVFVGDERVEVIDFEGAGNGLPYEDVAYFLVQLEQFFPGPILGRQFRPLGAAFLAGYLPATHSFDWTAYELCRIASALKVLRSTSAGGGGLRVRWRRRMLRGIILGGAA